LQRLSQKITAARYDHIGVAADQFGRDLVDPLEMSLRRPTLQHHVLPLSPSERKGPAVTDIEHPYPPTASPPSFAVVTVATFILTTASQQ
jgi:hypothetical protein